jgi:hypothetical protein
MFVLVHKNRIINGPRAWNSVLFEYSLQRVKVNATVPRRPPEDLPAELAPDTVIWPARVITPDHNTLTQRVHGPYWTFNDDTAVGTYQVADRDIEQVQEILRQRVALSRWQREIAGTTTQVQQHTVYVDTHRETREIFHARAQRLEPEQTIGWKFGALWLDVTAQDLAAVTAAIDQHVQQAYDWEQSKWLEIQQAETLSQLAEIVTDWPNEDGDDHQD